MKPLPRSLDRDIVWVEVMLMAVRDAEEFTMARQDTFAEPEAATIDPESGVF